VIDFRYHIVSLVSVFIALAVGIVLGAGPLRDNIGDALNREVTSLRKDRDALKTSMKTADAQVAHRDAFITEVQKPLVSGQLAGRPVVLVALPGVKGEAVDQQTVALTDAGAAVVGTVRLRSAWTDVDAVDARAAALGAVAAASTPSPASTSSPASTPSPGPTGEADRTADQDARLAELLARALLVSGGNQPVLEPPQRQVLQRLGDAGLISLDSMPRQRGVGAVLMAPGNSTTDSTEASPTPTSDVESRSYVALARSLDSAGLGAVVSGPASAALDDGVVAAARRDGAAAKEVPTVDSGGTPMGAVSTVLALRVAMAGGAGKYGFGDGVSAPIPSITPVSPSTPASGARR
jgi:hypothetical protein